MFTKPLLILWKFEGWQNSHKVYPLLSFGMKDSKSHKIWFEDLPSQLLNFVGISKLNFVEFDAFWSDIVCSMTIIVHHILMSNELIFFLLDLYLTACLSSYMYREDFLLKLSTWMFEMQQLDGNPFFSLLLMLCLVIELLLVFLSLLDATLLESFLPKALFGVNSISSCVFPTRWSV